jgi:hypothetical protein
MKRGSLIVSKLIINILLVLVFNWNNLTIGQEYAFVIKNQFPSEIYADFSFTINGIKLKKDNCNYWIRINVNGIDSIRFESKLQQVNHLIYIKFKKNTEYQIYENSCSYYEIAPLKSDSVKDLNTFLRLIKKNTKKEDTVIINSAFAHLDKKEQIKSDTTYYYKCLHSRACLYGTSYFEIFKNNFNYMQDGISYKNKDICENIQIQFLQSEKFSIIWDFKYKSCQVKFDGYFNPQKDVAIENEFGSVLLKR